MSYMTVFDVGEPEKRVFSLQSDHFQPVFDLFWPKNTCKMAFFDLKNLDFLEFFVRKIKIFQKLYFDLFYRSEP